MSAAPGRKKSAALAPVARSKAELRAQVAAVLVRLERMGSQQVRESLLRYGIVASKAFGIAMGDLQKLARELGRDHKLALALWESGWYEARIVASYVAEPDEVTPALMDRWCRDFDNWGICDTVCFVLFDRSPHALRKIEQWAARKPEFEKRAAFALLASVALHDKKLPDGELLRLFPLMERDATDPRNFVKKGVSWALRVIGGRRSRAMHAKSVALAEKLATSDDAAARWVGKDALRDLMRPMVVRRLK